MVLFALILAVAALIYLRKNSSFLIFPLTRRREAVDFIEEALKLDPQSFLLHKRIALSPLIFPDGIGRFRRRLEKVVVHYGTRKGLLDLLEELETKGRLSPDLLHETAAFSDQT